MKSTVYWSHFYKFIRNVTYETGWDNLRPGLVCIVYALPMNPTPPTFNTQIILPVVHSTGSIIWEVEGRESGSKGVAYHTDSPTQVEDRRYYLGGGRSGEWA